MAKYIQSYDEESIGRDYFSLTDSECRKTALAVTFGNQTTQAILKIVARYLLHSNEQHKLVYDLEDILRKYSIVLIYLFLKEKSKKVDLLGPKGLNLYNETFESILEGGITYDKLVHSKFTSSNELVKVYLKDSIDGNEYKQILKELRRKIYRVKFTKYEEQGKMHDILTNNEVEAIYNLLSKDASFFYERRTSFNDIFNNSMRNLDMLVAEAQYESEFVKFNIEIPEDQVSSYLENFYKDDGASGFDKSKRGLVILGYFVHGLLKRKDFNCEQELDLISPVQLRFHARSKNVSASRGKNPSLFIFVNSNNKLEKSNVTPFNFKYNDKMYRLSKQGLEIL